MQGLMQHWPLTVDRIIDHAARVHGTSEVVTRRHDRKIYRTNYATIQERAKRLSSALLSLGILPGDRVATLAWNSERHLECWYGVMGIGAVVHTLNPRLHSDQLVWIANDAAPRVLVLDEAFVSLIEPLRSRLPFRHYVVIAEPEAMPANELGALSFEELIVLGNNDVSWGGFDETTACGLCYTSGTTGNPKGVLYSHRSNVLHALMVLGKGALGIGSDDVVLPIVPMFHANAWGLAFACPAAGAKLVLPGGHLDGASVFELLESEKVTFSAAVPTVWLSLLQHLREHDLALSHLKRVVIGGAALPESIRRAFEEDYDVEVVHAWGMTETSPTGTIGGVPTRHSNTDPTFRIAQKLKQGRPPFGVELRLVDESDAELPWDGATQGRLKVRGFAVAESYFNGAGGAVLDARGYFDTGDVATIDEFGTMQITDRSKDVIKSGGEWISSIAIENVALSHPAVANAAAIGVPHSKWGERPVLVVERKESMTIFTEDLRKYLEDRIARWWIPDAFLYVDTIPLAPTGKVDKRRLREMFAKGELLD